MKKLFGRDDLKITDMLLFAWGQGYEIQFKIDGYNIQLFIPVLEKVTIEDYLRYGDEAFKLRIYYERVPSCWDWIGSTFEEEKLKDILDVWIHGKKEQELVDKLTPKEEEK